MKYIKAIAVAAGLACAAATSQANIILNYSATDDSVINFTAGGFTFVNIVNAALPTFDITSTSGSSANHDSVGFLGFITGGPFVIGTINGSGTQASVSGTGALTISDGIKNLTATVIWNTIGQAGVGNVLNLNGQINLTSISYSGNSVDLKALANVSTGIQTVSFSFAGSQPSLQDLKNGGMQVAFAGQISSISAVPEPTTVIAGALLLLPFGLSTLRIIRRR